MNNPDVTEKLSAPAASTPASGWTKLLELAIAAWWASALTTMIWEQVSGLRNPLFPVCYGIAFAALMLTYKKVSSNEKVQRPPI